MDETLTEAKDEIPLDEDAIRKYEDKITEKIDNPIEELDTDRHGEESGEKEKTLTPQSKIIDAPLPKSMFSMWIMDAQRIEENQGLYLTTLPNAYVNPQHGLLLFSIAFSTWNLVKHGFAEKKDSYQYVENELADLQKNCEQMGITFSNHGKPNMVDYMKFIKKLNAVWANIMQVKAALGLSIRFKRKDKAMDIIDKYKRDPTQAIGVE